MSLIKKYFVLIPLGIFLLYGILKSSNKNITDMLGLYLDSLKKSFGMLTSIQLANASLIIMKFQKIGDEDLRKLNYILATAWHESKFYTIKEVRGRPGTDLYNLQEKYWYSGFFGRGFVQLTFKENYEKFSKILGIDLVSNPDLALNDNVAATIINYGMLNGTFTGKKLSDYINYSKVDYYSARRIVNSLDRAAEVESYAKLIASNLLYPIA